MGELVPKGRIQLQTENGCHLAQSLPAIQTMLAGPMIQLKQAVGDPKLQCLRSEADPFRTAKAMGQEHGGVPRELAGTPLEHQGEPGIESIGSQGPQTRLGDF